MKDDFMKKTVNRKKKMTLAGFSQRGSHIVFVITLLIIINSTAWWGWSCDLHIAAIHVPLSKTDFSANLHFNDISQKSVTVHVQNFIICKMSASVHFKPSSGKSTIKRYIMHWTALWRQFIVHWFTYAKHHCYLSSCPAISDVSASVCKTK